MKIVALDIGSVRIGIATCDVMEIIASPLMVYRRKNEQVDVKEIAKVISSLDAGEVVVGLPLKMDGSEGQSVEMAKHFAELLSHEISIPIVFEDERLTTVSAERVLIESGMRREKRKDKIDSVAATFILQTHLEKRRNLKRS